ncbi:MAG TPA: fused MFS/spermidine synthase [Opitutaceae bacterium]
MIPVVFHTLVIVLGALSMGFQLLASRLLNPHFGSSIIVWAWLISTFLAAFSTGSILGGWISGLPPKRRSAWRTRIACVGMASLGITALSGRPLLGWLEIHLADMNTGLLAACAGLFFVPVTSLSSFGPQCVQFLAARGRAPGSASGLVYGVSTIGNIAGVMLTAFLFIPRFPVSTLMLIWLVVAIVSLAILMAILRSSPEEVRS